MQLGSIVKLFLLFSREIRPDESCFQKLSLGILWDECRKYSPCLGTLLRSDNFLSPNLRRKFQVNSSSRQFLEISNKTLFLSPEKQFLTHLRLESLECVYFTQLGWREFMVDGIFRRGDTPPQKDYFLGTDHFALLRVDKIFQK